MSEKRTFQQVVDEARAEMARWPESMKQLNEYRRAEMRKLDRAHAGGVAPVRSAGSSTSRRTG